VPLVACILLWVLILMVMAPAEGSGCWFAMGHTSLLFNITFYLSGYPLCLRSKANQLLKFLLQDHIPGQEIMSVSS
jgi:hypothetical protein